MTQLSPWLATPIGAAMLLAGGCAASSDDNAEHPFDSRAPVGVVVAGLTPAEDCDQLLERVQGDAIAKADLAVLVYSEAARAGFPRFDDGFDTGGFGGGPGVAGGSDDQTGSNGSASDGDAAGGGDFQNGGDDFSGPDDYSDTNVQVADVDEADIVKVANDGERIYLLHGSQLFAISAWPAESMDLFGEPVNIEGMPQEMFVHDGKAVIFSHVESYDDERFEASGRTGPYDDSWRQFTKVTVLDVADETPGVLRELYYEGQYTSSRRHDDFVRIVMQAEQDFEGLFHPDIEPFDAWDRPYPQKVIDSQLAEWRGRTVSAIENTELRDWLPDTYEAVDGTIERLDPACDSFLTPTAGVAGWGLTRLVGLDMSAPEANLAASTVMGQATVVYANRETMVLAQPDYRGMGGDSGLVDIEQTALHVFSIEGAQSLYSSSGWIEGHPLNQFAIDALDDVIRVSTTGWRRADPDAEQFSDDWWTSEPVNQVIALREVDGALQVASTTGPIGHENETIQSTRFLGDRAYVVTFEQTDPLIVIDVSDADALEALGEVEIPGFSTYMHPLGDDHLLTIGQSGDWGVQMQIFDVSEDLNPVRTHLHDYGASSSEARTNHKAFNYYAAHDLLAIPIESYGSDYRTGLDVLRVSIEDGFTELGRVDHTAFAQVECETWQDGDQVFEECWNTSESSVRRGVFMSDADDTYVYSIGYGGVMAHELRDLDVPLSSIDLPEPDHHYDDGWLDGGGTTAGPVSSGGGDVGPTPAGEPTPDRP